jgi:UDP-2,3-diacylglucosamine hydrolase
MTRTAVIAGQGALPGLLVAGLEAAGDTVLLAEMDGFPASVPGHQAVRFRIERLVPFLDHLADQRTDQVVMAGAVRRPQLDPELFDARTATLVPRLIAAMQKGDDGALREVIAIFEDWDLKVVGSHEVLPDLLPQTGIPTRLQPSAQDRADAVLGEATVAEMGQADTGQACIVRQGRVVAREADTGTDAMLDAFCQTADRLENATAARTGILFKAPKPGQDRRVDLPVIGPATALWTATAGLAGIVIEAGGVMVLDRARLIADLDAAGMFLWVRPHGNPA